MSTYTVEAFYLGVLDDLDTNEGDFDTENAASLNGTTFGSEGDPLFQRTAKLTLTDSNSGGTIRENDAGGNDEPLTYDGVASGLDSVTQYNVLVTYADGSTALTKMYLLQDESGRSFLSPSASGSADNDALDDKPIESITVQSVAEDTFSRITADLDQNAFVGQVDGTTGDDVIDASYSDADGDRVNEADTRADVIDAGAGNDTVSSGAGDDMVYGGTGDDSLDGGEGDDTIEGGGGSDTIEGGDGDDSLTGGDDASDSNLFLDWSAVGADGRDITGGFTQDTGGIKVTVDYTNDGNATGFNVESTTSQYVGAGDPFDPNSSGILYGGGNTGDTSTVTMDFEAVNGSGYDDEVRDVSFRINDIDQYRDGSGWDDKVTIRAYDADGNLLPITITYQGITTTSTEPSVGGNANYGSTSEGGSMLIEIAGPVARIEVDYDQTGNSGQLIFISDVHFTAHATDDGDDDIKGGAGADSIKGMAGNDTLDGGTGADLVDGGTGDDLITVDQGDTVSGGEGDDFFTLEDLDTTGTGNDSISIDGGSGDEKGGDTLRLTPDVKRSDITFTDSDPDGGYAGYFTMADGTVVHFKNIENIICFTPGTRILTEVGERPVETLRLGDRVVTRDSGVQPIRWIGTRTVPGRGRFAPVHVASSVLDGSRSGLVVSPQHRLLFTGYQAELLFGESEVLVPAKHLIDGMDVTRVEQEEVTYIHLMFDHHEIIYAEGIATESFHAGDIGLTALCEEAREELFALFPELRSAPQTLGDTARPCLRAYEAKLLRESFTGAWS